MCKDCDKLIELVKEKQQSDDRIAEKQYKWNVANESTIKSNIDRGIFPR